MKATIGTAVTFVDENREDRAAIVTFVFPGMSGQADGVNVVIACKDTAREDSYGRQSVTRQCSVERTARMRVRERQLRRQRISAHRPGDGPTKI